jgi:hypothetical protein
MRTILLLSRSIAQNGIVQLPYREPNPDRATDRLNSATANGHVHFNFKSLYDLANEPSFVEFVYFSGRASDSTQLTMLHHYESHVECLRYDFVVLFWSDTSCLITMI